MEAYMWPALLLAGGILLIFLEIFVPSGGALSVMAAICVIAAVVTAFQQGFLIGTVTLFVATVMVPLAISLGIKWWPHTPLGKLILAKRPESAEEVLPDTDEYHRHRLVGADGVAVTDLLPSGDVRFEGRLYDAVSNGVAINRGQAVRVVDVNTQRLVVRPLSDREVAERDQVDDVLATPLDQLGIESLDDPLA